MYYNKDGTWIEKGVGNLHLKPCSGKTQLLIRADTNLGENNLIIKTTRNLYSVYKMGVAQQMQVSMENSSCHLQLGPFFAKFLQIPNSIPVLCLKIVRHWLHDLD